MNKSFAILTLVLAASTMFSAQESRAENSFEGRKIVLQSDIKPSYSIDVHKSVDGINIGHTFYTGSVSSCTLRYDRYFDADVVTDLTLRKGTEFTIIEAGTYVNDNALGFPTGSTVIRFDTSNLNISGDLDDKSKEYMGERFAIDCGGNPHLTTLGARLEAGSVRKALKIIGEKFNFVVK